MNNYCINGVNVILIAPPDKSSKEIKLINLSKGILVLRSKKKGQVYQRQYGYNFCKTSLILHMDDDIYFDLNSLKGLLNIFNNLPEECCLAPKLKVGIENNICKINLLIFLRNYFLYSSLSPKPGTIALSSFPVPYDCKKNSKSTRKVDWIAGGISLIREKNCIKESYFNFTGKAYCEDLFVSNKLKKNNINLYINDSLTYETKLESYRSLNFKEFISYIRNDFKIRNYFRKIIKNPIVPFLLAYFYLIISFLLTKLINKNRF